ncbi:type II secretion system F family protein [Kitasatospora sp. NBC_00315]|uniref:type II secretion system F family protein n=1 Tax=Kitasatospora sp. NBC_00315 TaxID=2975963 RepID=UPI00325040D7
MTARQIDAFWAAVLCGTALLGRQVLRRQAVGVRHRRLLPGAAGGAGRALATAATAAMAPAARLRRGVTASRAFRPRWLVPELVLLPVALTAAEGLSSPLPLLVGAAGVVPLRRWRARRRSELGARRRATAVVELCTALAAELRSGATPEQALHTVTTSLARDRALLDRLGEEPVARLAAGRYGGDVPAAFGLLAELPGGRGAAAVAACWRVASGSGAGLADGLDQVAESLRSERALAEEIEGELAAPRATITVLAVLPVLGLLLGSTLGARPLDILLHSATGLGCLAGGALLELAGLVWTARIVRTARGVHDGPGSRPAAGERALPGERASTCGIARRRVTPGTPPTPVVGGTSVRVRSPATARVEQAGARLRRAVLG